ncbi:hypothetical protein LEP1GSC115_0904 [Leptospira interrogans serovar Australis str. 200703203]|uniref:Uncharacterized protein n=1 Tax=Leptospira interrogans serovar Australis str. 200703203 TaxID=1085541 RepID=N1UIR6_LEPIR|nr:hypothetical protein LEP1GSC115_0904 [Leptospira interrogans serovar Australis str. 200703203]
MSPTPFSPLPKPFPTSFQALPYDRTAFCAPFPICFPTLPKLLVALLSPRDNPRVFSLNPRITGILKAGILIAGALNLKAFKRAPQAPSSSPEREIGIASSWRNDPKNSECFDSSNPFSCATRGEYPSIRSTYRSPDSSPFNSNFGIYFPYTRVI